VRFARPAARSQAKPMAVSPGCLRPNCCCPGDWIGSLDDVSHWLVVQAIDVLADRGPGVRPSFSGPGRVEYSSVQNLRRATPAIMGTADAITGTSSQVVEPGKRSVILIIRRS